MMCLKYRTSHLGGVLLLETNLWCGFVVWAKTTQSHFYHPEASYFPITACPYAFHISYMTATCQWWHSFSLLHMAGCDFFFFYPFIVAFSSVHSFIVPYGKLSLQTGITSINTAQARHVTVHQMWLGNKNHPELWKQAYHSHYVSDFFTFIF